MNDIRNELQDAIFEIYNAVQKVNDVRKSLEKKERNDQMTQTENNEPLPKGRKKYFTEEERKAGQRKASYKYYWNMKIKMAEMERELEELRSKR